MRLRPPSHLDRSAVAADNTIRAQEVIDKAFPGSFVRRDAATAGNLAAYETALTAATDEPAMQRFLKPLPLAKHLAGPSGVW
jgi:hypothetical protein